MALSNLNKKERELMTLMERATADYDADMSDKYWEGVDVGMERILDLLDKGYSANEIREMIAARD